MQLLCEFSRTTVTLQVDEIIKYSSVKLQQSIFAMSCRRTRILVNRGTRLTRSGDSNFTYENNANLYNCTDYLPVERARDSTRATSAIRSVSETYIALYRPAFTWPHSFIFTKPDNYAMTECPVMTFEYELYVLPTCIHLARGSGAGCIYLPW